MKLIVTDLNVLPTSSPITLGDETKGDILDFGDPDRRQASQEVGYVRAEQKEYFDRGNVSLTETVTIYRMHASRAAALAYYTDHAKSLPRKGNVSLIETGSGQTIRYMNPALIQVRPIRFQGVSTLFHYSFSGGDWTPNKSQT